MGLKSRKREYKPDLTVEEALLRIPNKPDPVRRKKRVVGKHTRKGLCQFLFELFELNEKLPKNAKRTNAALVDVVIKEFPAEYDLHVRLRRWEKTSINYYRQKYNTGALVPGRAVQYISFRYNEHGDRVDYATGKKLMPQVMQTKLLQRYRTKLLESHLKYWGDVETIRETEKQEEYDQALIESARQAKERKRRKRNERETKTNVENSSRPADAI